MYYKKYYQDHREQLLANHEKWRKANKAKLAKKAKKRYQVDAEYRKRRLESNHKYAQYRWKTDPEFRKARSLAQLKVKYNITPEDLNNLLIEQKYSCAICKKPTKLCVDHDHKTGRIRGLLCKKCNMWLSWFDNKKKFKTILKYIGR